MLYRGKLAMTAIFHDLQDPASAQHGTRLHSVDAMVRLWDSFSGRAPFLFWLQGDNGFTLMVGFAGDCGIVQHGASSGEGPYLMAVSDEAVDDDSFLDFLTGGELTSIPRRYCISTRHVMEIVDSFLSKGERSAAVRWEKI
jgi:immunity protein Imm1 of predicted polymorphic toxin system